MGRLTRMSAWSRFTVQSPHFSFLFCTFLLLFCFYVGGSTSTRSISNSLLSFNLFNKDRFVENARDHGAHKFDHSDQPIINICSNNMYFFLSMIAQLMFCLEEFALGNWVPLPPNPSLLF